MSQPAAIVEVTAADLSLLSHRQALVSLLNVTDFVGAASKIAQRDSRVVEMYLFVAIIYFVLCFALSYAVKRLQLKIAIIR